MPKTGVYIIGVIGAVISVEVLDNISHKAAIIYSMLLLLLVFKIYGNKIFSELALTGSLVRGKQ
jgi:uncharacterized membrane protein